MKRGLRRIVKLADSIPELLNDGVHATLANVPRLAELKKQLKELEKTISKVRQDASDALGKEKRTINKLYDCPTKQLELKIAGWESIKQNAIFAVCNQILGSEAPK